MTDKEFKRLSRSQLIDIIYQLQLKQEELTADNEKLSKALADKRLRVSKVGNIAEAALEIHNVMQSAQDVADHYLEEIKIRVNHEYQRILKEAKEADLLTSFGKSVYKKVKELRSDAKGRDGGLSPLGTQEHKGIAERMYKAFPEVFSGNAIIDCRSTEAPRCILSMAANNERLKELNPSLRIYRSAYEGDEEERVIAPQLETKQGLSTRIVPIFYALLLRKNLRFIHR